MTPISFSIPVQLPTLNTLLRMHWKKRGDLQETVSTEVWAALGAAGYYRNARTPLERCRVVVRRHSTQEPDPDGLRSTAKLLLDVLQPASTRHPRGLGVIKEDNSKCVELEVVHVPSRQKFHITEVEIHAL